MYVCPSSPLLICTNCSPADTRILIMFLLDKSVRPTPQDLKLWVDLLRFIKRGAPGGALSFFTYMELSTSLRRLFNCSRLMKGLCIAIWVVTFMFFRWGRLKWYVSLCKGRFRIADLALVGRCSFYLDGVCIEQLALENKDEKHW